MYTKGIDGSELHESDIPGSVFPGSPSIRSEGQLYNFQNGYTQSQSVPEPEALPVSGGSITGRLKGLLGGFETDDLLLIAIGILLLLDGDEDNDVLLIFILALLFL